MGKDRLSVIITKGGDQGKTSLGGGQRVLKSDARIEAYGTIDELNSIVGLVRNVSDLDQNLQEPLMQIQHDLFTVGSELCFVHDDLTKYKVACIKDQSIEQLESWAKKYNEHLEPLKEFILPAGPCGAAELHMARTICRRAERRLVALAQQEEVRLLLIAYVNRLSDLLFILSRYVLQSKNIEPTLWERPQSE